MGIARSISVRMSCDRAQIGCVIVSADHRILSGGYGGAPSGWPSCDEAGHLMAAVGVAGGDSTFVEAEELVVLKLSAAAWGVDVSPLEAANISRLQSFFREAFRAGRKVGTRQSCIRTVHAEENAVCTAARHGVALNGSTLYTTASTCWDCLKMVAQAGIIRIVYGEVYSGGRNAGMDIIAIARERGIEMLCLPAEPVAKLGEFAPPPGYTCMDCGVVGPAEHVVGCGGNTLKAS